MAPEDEPTEEPDDERIVMLDDDGHEHDCS
jgi:hypothetical protein